MVRPPPLKVVIVVVVGGGGCGGGGGGMVTQDKALTLLGHTAYKTTHSQLVSVSAHSQLAASNLPNAVVGRRSGGKVIAGWGAPVSPVPEHAIAEVPHRQDLSLPQSCKLSNAVCMIQHSP
jgi:hypothetical protein